MKKLPTLKAVKATFIRISAKKLVLGLAALGMLMLNSCKTMDYALFNPKEKNTNLLPNLKPYLITREDAPETEYPKSGKMNGRVRRIHKNTQLYYSRNPQNTLVRTGRYSSLITDYPSKDALVTFQREVKNNICDTTGAAFGYIKLRLVNGNVKNTTVRQAILIPLATVMLSIAVTALSDPNNQAIIYKYTTLPANPTPAQFSQWQMDNNGQANPDYNPHEKGIGLGALIAAGGYFLGVSTGIIPLGKFQTDLDLEAEIFDSKNNSIGKYVGSGSGNATVGVFHYRAAGESCASRKAHIDAFNEALMNIKKQINNDAGRINKQLIAAGPLKSM